jgi:pantothenate kinase type III
MHPLFATISARSAGTSIDPLVQMPLHIGGAVCPGTQLSFVTYHAGENFRLELDIPEVSLDQYVAH